MIRDEMELSGQRVQLANNLFELQYNFPVLFFDLLISVFMVSMSMS